MSEAILPALGVVFAAFVVWLTVRIVNRRERWAKRTALAFVVVLVLYPLSMGPAYWITGRTAWTDLWTWYPVCAVAYWPVWEVARHSAMLGDAVEWYVALGIDPNLIRE